MNNISHIKKIVTFILASTFLLIFNACNETSPVRNCETYTEPTDPSPDSTANWDAVPAGLNATIGSINTRYPKSSIPKIQQDSWESTAWKGEKISLQLVLWSKEPINQVEIKFSRFKSSNGNKIATNMAKARFVRSVITDEFACGCCSSSRNENGRAEIKPKLSPDVLDTVSCYDIEEKSTRPVWITLKVPANAQPGIYSSTMDVLGQNQKIKSFELKLEVQNRILPPPSEWKFHLDLWQHPYSIAGYYNIKPWSKEHWELLKPITKMLAEAGQKVITTSLNEKPWNQQTNWGFDGMIKWSRKKDHSWKYNYTDFDNYVQFMMDHGIDKQINCYSLISWGSKTVYFDEFTNQNDTVKYKPGTTEYEAIWIPFLKDFRKHLEEKGWYKITNLAMDEIGYEPMKKMLAMLDNVAPEFGIALADDSKAYQKFPDRIKDLSVSYVNGNVDLDDIEYRKSKGYATTYYICCSDEFPNTFTFTPPAYSAFAGWYAIAAEYDGLLRWSYTSWPKDPIIDSRFNEWSAGDTYLIYPGPLSSIRFERLVEGIQDAEKIRTLRKEFEEAGTNEAKQKLNILNVELSKFNIQKKPDNAEELLNNGKRILNELSR